MKLARRPMTATILYGLACALAFIPASLGLAYFTGWSLAFNLTLWTFAAGYGLVLAGIGRTRPGTLALPLMVLLGAAVFTQTRTGFLVLALGVLAWIRSGNTLDGQALKKISAEVLAAAGGGALVAFFAPQTALSWALAVWMFFLVQSLYFVIIGQVGEWAGPETEPDRFERARRRAEAILSESP